MNTKILIVVALIAIIIVAGVAGASLFVKTDRLNQINKPEGRFKMDISGRVDIGFAGIGDWSIDDYKYNVEQMTESDAGTGFFGILGFWDPWNSGPMIVKAFLDSPSGVRYTVEQKLGSYNVWLGGSKPFNLHLDMIVPNTSPFTLTISLFENAEGKTGRIISGIKILPANG
ncbi:MAG: hypothetical protein IMZ64_06210 [Bacteroidetes bacterium]|nr:hypothetical protein [Bacteroidota bacterium]